MYKSLINICNLNVLFTSESWHLHGLCEPYLLCDESVAPDIVINVTDEMIEKENIDNLEMTPTNIAALEASSALRELCAQLLKYDAFLLHAAVICVDNKAIAFCAKSGTGKTTHMNLWSKLLGDRLKIINGDKPIIRFIDGIPYAYGTPWNGKEHLHTNMSARLTDICFIERSENNSVISVSEKEATQRLSSQLVAPSSIDGMMKNMQFLDGLLKNCNIHIINCNMDISAAEIAYNAIFNKE